MGMDWKKQKQNLSLVWDGPKPNLNPDKNASKFGLPFLPDHPGRVKSDLN